MAGKKMMIVLLPEGSKRVRQFSVPKILIGFLFILCLSVALVLGWVVKDYIAVKTQIPRLAILEKENADQKVQLFTLADKIDQISRRVVDLKKFDSKLKTMVNLEVSQDNTQLLGIGGSDSDLVASDSGVQSAHRKLVRAMHRSLDNLDKEISVRNQEKSELCGYLESQKSRLLCTPSIWPSRGWISSGFGYRISPFTNQKEFHKGVDICSRMKTPIIAPADGIVASTGMDYGYGKTVTVSHGYGLVTRYAHVHKALVKKGDHVKRGQQIALVGNTGRTTGPHLHYEVHLNGVPVNPLQYILN
ncbi:MAG: M23 family metallopeptidase [Deltaproteobacteria bacterium]|nr:M23 family metallopeptidase [Deltaproteobacteria bacterium]